MGKYMHMYYVVSFGNGQMYRNVANISDRAMGNYYGPTLREGHLDLPLSIGPSICLKIFILLQRWEHPCF